MNTLDLLQKKLIGYFNKTSVKNGIKLFDTPKIWGLPFGKEIMPASIQREKEFEDAIFNIIKKMHYRCDISSLNAPDAEWRKVVLAAIDTAFTQKCNRQEPPQIRFLFAQTPTSVLNGVSYYFEGTPDYLAFKKELIELVKERGPYWECIPEMWIGRFYRIIDGALMSFEKKVLPECLIPQTDTRMTWNHTKIIAIDGYHAFVGGHNLNMDLFKNYPPVHDVSVEVCGPAAYDSQLFLNKMWDCGHDLLTKEYFDSSENSWVNADTVTDKPLDPFDKAYVRTYAKTNQRKIIKECVKDPEFKVTSRILSVGKYWTGPDRRTDYQLGSEVMKEFLIKNAKKSIRLSQQDLISTWKSKWDDHPVCKWIIEALLANPNLKVQVVVSPLDAGAGAYGDQYSFGSGARRTFELFKYYLFHDVNTDQPLDDPNDIRLNALKRIEIAPFFFTDKVPDELTIEGETYKWPDQDQAAYTATLKEVPLAKSPPKQGIIGHPFKALIKGSGYVYPKVPSAPANHAKVAIFDDELYVVGSDNMYPGYLSEFNYVVEGKEAVKYFIDSYWQPLWNYSAKYACNYKNT